MKVTQLAPLAFALVLCAAPAFAGDYGSDYYGYGEWRAEQRQAARVAGPFSSDYVVPRASS